ncbi:MAG: cysteine-rich small domain-containing protein [Coriobacteriales bacterium]
MARTGKYPFFSHRACPYFPCHEGVDPDDFNCLFCYCPLYTLGPDCGGDFVYTETGVKDCSGCTRLHEGDRGSELVREKFSALADLARIPQAGDGGLSGDDSRDAR